MSINHDDKNHKEGASKMEAAALSMTAAIIKIASPIEWGDLTELIHRSGLNERDAMKAVDTLFDMDKGEINGDDLIEWVA